MVLDVADPTTLTRLVVQRTAIGQPLAQSGFAGFWPGQQGMPSGIEAMASAAMTGTAADAAIGAATNPISANTKKARPMADQNFMRRNMSY